jgi:transposase
VQGEKRFEPKLFYNIGLLEFIGEDHFLVKLDEVLSLEWIRQRTRSYYSHTGKPSIDPVVLVKMLLVGYLYDIRSERRLVEEVRLNLAYRWFVGYDLDEVIPDHSIFTKARARFGRELFLELFEAILAECMRAGLVRGDGILVDSTLVKADASLNSVIEVDLPPATYWRELESEEERSDDPRGRKPKDGHRARQVGAIFNGGVDPDKLGKRRRDRNASYLRKRSKTDPDATMHYRPGIGGILSYKVHAAADTGGVVTAVSVSASSEHDTSALPALLSMHSKNLGKPASVAADSTYGTSEALLFLQEQDIKTAIPPMPPRGQRGCFPKSAFTWDKEADHYICPEGKVLSRRSKNQKTGQIPYKARPEDCSSCPSRYRCISGKKAKARSVSRLDGDFFEEATGFLKSPAGTKLFALRKTVIEGIFGQSKTQHGLSRAKMRGLEKMEIQALMTATAINLKKLVRHHVLETLCRFFALLKASNKRSPRFVNHGILRIRRHLGNRPV